MYVVPYYGSELYHHGVKGMKWGIRRDRRVSNKLKSYRDKSKDPKTDFLKINRPNSAARSYYRQHKAKTMSTYLKQSTIMDKKIVGLSKDQIENGRYRVARARNIKRKTLSALLGVGAGVASIPVAGPGSVAIGGAVAVGANFVTGGHYYQGQSAAYGSRRARREVNG